MLVYSPFEVKGGHFFMLVYSPFEVKGGHFFMLWVSPQVHPPRS